MNTRRVNAAADVIDRARKNGKETPAGWALALESAQMLMSPEIAAELVQLRNDVTGACLARWEEEQENARLRLALESAKRGRRELRAQVAALLEERHVTNEVLSEAAEALRENRDRFAALEQQTAGEAMPVMVSPREPVEDLYDYQRRHTYRLGRDLPPLDGVL